MTRIGSRNGLPYGEGDCAVPGARCHFPAPPADKQPVTDRERGRSPRRVGAEVKIYGNCARFAAGLAAFAGTLGGDPEKRVKQFTL